MTERTTTATSSSTSKPWRTEWPVVQELHARNIIFDFREPDIIRAGCSPLTTRFTDVYDGLRAVAGLG